MINLIEKIKKKFGENSKNAYIHINDIKLSFVEATKEVTQDITISIPSTNTVPGYFTSFPTQTQYGEVHPNIELTFAHPQFCSQCGAECESIFWWSVVKNCCLCSNNTATCNKCLKRIK